MNERIRQTLSTSAKIIFSLGIIYSISFWGFSKKIKEQAIKIRGNRCENCNTTDSDHLYPHHDLPKQMGGSNSLFNLFLACAKCHPKLDRAVIRHGRLADGTHIEDVASDYPEKIDDWEKYNKAVTRLRKSK